MKDNDSFPSLELTISHAAALRQERDSLRQEILDEIRAEIKREKEEAQERELTLILKNPGLSA